MKIQKIKECGYEEALLGLSLSYNQPIEKMERIAKKSPHNDTGENKFLESIYLWLDVTAPRFIWCEMDTYRLTTKQSESTMHTITKRLLTQQDFEYPIFAETLDKLNLAIQNYNNEDNTVAQKEGYFHFIKANLPEGLLQRRIWVMNYKVLRNIYFQRKSHRLEQWHIFLDTLMREIDHPEFILRGENDQAR